MKQLLLSILLLICATTSMAQELSVKEFREATNDISARTLSRQDINGNDCALVKVQVAISDAIFVGNVVGDTHFMGSEYWVYMAEGSKHLKVNTNSYLPIDITFADYGIKSLIGKTTYVLKIILPKENTSLFKPTRFYVGAEGMFGMMNSVGGSIGAYIYNVNIELFYHYGLTSSEEVFWNDITSIDGSLPYSYTYKASSFGAKIGYGICIGKRFCLTPQVGIGSVSISGTEIQKGDNNPAATKGYTLDLSLGTRMEYIISNHFGIMISPEYDLAVSKSDLFNRVSEVSSKVKNFGTGFNIRVGLFATF